MNKGIFYTLKGYKKENLGPDIFSGFLVALVCIPISMGYAEVAGLPAVYGLYGSILPLVIFALLSTSRQFIFSVDAAPAAITGAAVLAAGYTAGSADAMAFVPVVTLFCGLWLLLFYFIKAGRIVDYISTPVMGGFITGISTEIILMQIPKLFGSGSGSGELIELVRCICEAVVKISWPSLILGAASLAAILIIKKIAPKFPGTVAVMIAGVILTYFLGLGDYGVRTLSPVEPGLGPLLIPDLRGVDLVSTAGRALPASIVIIAETLLSENQFAFKNGYKLDDNREILAFSIANIVSAFTGCCPVNGSISRTSMNEQYGGKTQVVSLTAAGVLLVIVLFFTGFIGYLPVPVLAAIVISALMNVVEFDLAAKLYKVSRPDFRIFAGAFLGVLLLGSIYGVVIGIALSFAAVIIKGSNPQRGLEGVLPEKEGFFLLSQNLLARPIEHVVIYKFSENLFFANIKVFQNDVEEAVKEDTEVVIIDASAVNSIDVTAAERLEALAESMEKRGIKFYIAGHSAEVNTQLRSLGMIWMLEKGMARRQVKTALEDAGITPPYKVANPDKTAAVLMKSLPDQFEESVSEFLWAFGDSSAEEFQKRVAEIITDIHNSDDLENVINGHGEKFRKAFRSLSKSGEDQMLRELEKRTEEISRHIGEEDRRKVALLIGERRKMLEHKLEEGDPERYRQFVENRERFEKMLHEKTEHGTLHMTLMTEGMRHLAEKLRAAQDHTGEDPEKEPLEGNAEGSGADDGSADGDGTRQ
ncbi:MAG: SulP family inorganic anion transporter [Anaerovoracaceae bacterium]|nr:SulP family inorganic anion transporter [Bacillota bacterium]MDY2671320.1 SulP family inorganic anion transporter [Anaerovoracaceae bacterium]